MKFCSLGRWAGVKTTKLANNFARTKRKLDRHISVLVASSIQPYLRCFRNRTKEMIHDFFILWYLHYRYPTRVNSAIFGSRETEVILEMRQPRTRGKTLLLIHNGLACRGRPSVQLKLARATTLAFPSHMLHILAPLHLTVPGDFKSYYQANLHQDVPQLYKIVTIFYIGAYVCNA